MTTFDDREKAAEKKMVLDAQLQFKIEARRNKLLGLWVAEMIGKSEEEAKAYAVEVIKADMEEPGDEDVFRKLKADIADAGITMSDGEIRAQMNAFLETAQTQIQEEAG